MARLDTDDITACLVTRGDVDMEPILGSLLDYRDVIVWDNSQRPDWKCASRYLAAMQARTDWVYWQDDDTIVPAETQQALINAAGDDDIVANWGHGENPDGYDDLPLVCGGAVAFKWSAWDAITRYGAHHPLDFGFMYEADFVVGVLYRKWRHLHLPFEIRDVAYNGRRLADEPWQRALKLEITTRARTLRDQEKLAA